ncbi:MAG: cytochrome C [Deltaproteobacteria bacterium]|nr:cytochrome C [Deltaproteobacteria bacterium]
MLAMLIGLGWAASAAAIDWERMVMPGLLVAGHAELEEDCTSCHQAFEGDAQRALCLTCHEKVSDDLSGDVGFHGRSPLASTGQCRSCHPDHLGREADIMGVSEATFDHAQTDFALVGRHSTAACAECHREGQKRREAPVNCVDCHGEEDDAHDGALTTQCGDCHEPFDWHSTRFNHDDTKYPLTGAHVEVSCAGCHAGQRYEGTATDCLSCHAIDDAHAGRFGTDCAECHETARWVQKDFDHEQKSQFALSGSHATVSCVRCHREPPGKRKLPESCSGCHAQDDVHAGRFGDDCGSCHPATAWKKARFDHAGKTKFALRGAHERVVCNVCHTGRAAEAAEAVEAVAESACIDCHRRDDVHEEALGRDCGECHNEQSFSSRVLFDHELTEFPLLGLHAVAACESCHVDHVYRQKDLSCIACHTSDDVHERTLGKKCATCHNPNGWGHWRFDHDVDTEFALRGAHEGLVCTGCHRMPMTGRTRLSASCVDCHAGEDVHRGGFGRRCDDCHGDEAWKPARFGRRRGTRP